MKKLKCRYVIYLFCICSLFPCLLSSCKYDDSELIDRVDNLEDRLAKLEEQCKQINANINSLQTIVSALENANQITSVSELVENGKEVGYKIEFSKSDPIYIYHGQDGADGSDGTYGYVPQISVEKDKDGIYYWTLDGSWLTDKDGNKIKAVGLDGQDGEDGADGSDGSDGSNGSNGRDGVTPQLRINEGNWEVSYNNGASWKVLGSATGGTTPSPITGVEVKDGYVIFTLSTGDEIQVPLFNGITITFDKTEIGMDAGSEETFSYTLTGSDNVKVSAIGEGVRTSIDQTNKTLTITTDANFESGKVLVHATDGNNVATVELTITKEVITYIEYEATEEISPKTDAFGGTNIEFIEEKSSFSDSDGKGKWAFKGEVTYIIEAAFSRNTTLKSITLPESINDIGYRAYGQGGSAFENCTALESIVIKGNITTIRVRTFYGCSSLKSITLPESLERIDGTNAFYDCSSLEEIIIPDKVTTIGDKSFSFCTSLTKVTIGKSVTSIGKNCFNECKKLATITCKGENPPTLGSGALMKDKQEWGSLEVTKYIKNIYVPVNAVDTYKRTNGWNEFSDRISAITE